MKTLIIILIIAAFLQTTILPLDLVLIILICRSYIRTEKGNLYLAFFMGLLISHLNLTPIGIQSILYMISIQITQILSKSRLAGNSFMIIPLSLTFLLLNEVINGLILHQTFQISLKVLIESILSLPILYILKLWEERFIVRKDIKLKI